MTHSLLVAHRVPPVVYTCGHSEIGFARHGCIACRDDPYRDRILADMAGTEHTKDGDT